MNDKIEVNGNLLKLSNSQEQALVKLKEWYESKSLIFTLYGPAGTGKTTLINKFIKEIVRQPLCVTAPTHKATRVVEKITGRHGRTLQSLHGLRPNFNFEKFNIDNIRFETMGNIYMANYKLVIVDECSQINRELQELNELRSSQFSTKILYVGDRLQLPPVNQRESGTFNIKDKFELTDIVRQKDSNPLLTILDSLRVDMVSDKSNFIRAVKNKPININSKGEGYALYDPFLFKQELIKSFSSEDFKKDVDFCRYAAWTNNSVLSWNKFIRNTVLHKSKELIDEGDLLTGYRTIVDEYNTPIIVNSEDYRVKELEVSKTDYGFIVYKTHILNISDYSENIISILKHDDKDSFGKYYKVLQELHENAIYAAPNERGKKWREYYRFKDRYLSLTVIPLRNTSNITEIKATVPKDIDYGYGLTVHKLQGSTIENIYINLKDIYYYSSGVGELIKNTPKNPYAIETRNKLIYTGISRASKKVIILFE